MMAAHYPHRPVMVDEVIRDLITESDGVYVDGTVGSGGHSVVIAETIEEKGRLLCLDRDPAAVQMARERLSGLGKGIEMIKANFADLERILEERGVQKVHGVLLDLGFSSYQIEQSGRGFSFSREEPLDMRMDPESEVSARDLVNNLSVTALAKILREYGEEKRAKIIAKAVIREREKKGPITSSRKLADLIHAVTPTSHRHRSKDPATKTFQALRIAVNDELKHLRAFLETVPRFILKGGRVVILSYHSLEDRMVKRTIAEWERGCVCPPDLPRCACGKEPLFKRLHKKGLKPEAREIRANPRARSAVLRAAERI